MKSYQYDINNVKYYVSVFESVFSDYFGIPCTSLGYPQAMLQSGRLGMKGQQQEKFHMWFLTELGAEKGCSEKPLEVIKNSWFDLTCCWKITVFSKKKNG